MNRVSA